MELKKVAPATLRAIQTSLTSYLMHPKFLQNRPKRRFLLHGDAHICGAVRAAPTRAGCVVMPAGVCGHETKIAKGIFNLEPLNPILTSTFPPESPKNTFSQHGDAQTGGALRAEPCVAGRSVLPEGVRGRQTKIANHLLDV
jgi:hypothetical protein